MHGLFYSVTATFTTLLFALFLFLSEQFADVSSTLYNAPQARAHAIRLLETLRKDIQHVQTQDVNGTCGLTIARDGHTRYFTFPTLRMPGPDAELQEVQVTYELEGTGEHVQPRNGTRALYRLKRTLDDGGTRSEPYATHAQMVDFVIELIPEQAPDGLRERHISGACPDVLSEIYVEFHVAIQESPRRVSVSRYSSTIVPRGQP